MWHTSSAIDLIDLFTGLSASFSSRRRCTPACRSSMCSATTAMSARTKTRRLRGAAKASGATSCARFQGTFINAHRFERRRLRKEGPLGRMIYNRTFQGYGVLTGWMLAAFALGGLPGLLAFLLVAAIGLVIVELFQYISHYGLVRVPGTPVRADHSWEWSRAATSSFMLNLAAPLRPSSQWHEKLLGAQRDGPGADLSARTEPDGLCCVVATALPSPGTAIFGGLGPPICHGGRKSLRNRWLATDTPNREPCREPS
jgi:hypothetical protein